MTGRWPEGGRCQIEHHEEPGGGVCREALETGTPTRVEQIGDEGGYQE